MTPILYATVIISLTAVALTLFALFTAKDGFQDGEGFHAVRSLSPATLRHSRRKSANAKDDDHGLPYWPAH